MFSIGRVDQDRVNYYLDYARSSASPGRWIGLASQDFEIEAGSQVNEASFKSLFKAEHPNSGEKLLKQIQPGRRAGYDLTFSAPKSVSVLAYCHPDEKVRVQIRQAFRDSVEEAFSWAEKEVITARRGKGGRDGNVHTKIVGASFDHATTRLDDPHLHIHTVVPNIGLGEDGVNSSLDMRAIYQNRRQVGQVQQALLEAKLTQRLGIKWGEADQVGSREIEGTDRRFISEFSRRRMQILGYLAKAGQSGTKAAQIANLSTRARKTELNAEDLIPTWLQRLEKMRWSPNKLAQLVPQKTAELTSKIDKGQILKDLTQEKSSFGRLDVLSAIAVHLPSGIASVGKLEQLADEVLEQSVFISGSKTSVGHLKTQAAKFTTHEILAKEKNILDIAQRGKNRAIPVPQKILDQAIQTGRLVGEQAELVRTICGSDQVSCVVAPAGSGKTRSMGVGATAFQAQGRPVVGLGLSWAAANELSDVGVQASAIGRWKSPFGANAKFEKGSVVILDEASMVSTNDLDLIISQVAASDSNLILVGDPYQLSSVEAGGGYKALVEQLGAVNLSKNRRQVFEWEKKALENLRDGRVASALGTYKENDRIKVFDDPLDTVQVLISDWYEAKISGKETAILAWSKSSTAALNQLARAKLIEAGQVKTEGILVDDQDLGQREFSIGDEVRCLQKAKGVINGTLGTIFYINEETGEMIIEEKNGTPHKLSAAYVEENLNYAYASTVAKYQGKTVGTPEAARKVQIDNIARKVEKASIQGEVFILGTEGLSGEAAYVAFSRATDSSKIYLTNEVESEDEAIPGSKTDPIEALRRRVERNEGKIFGSKEAEIHDLVITTATTPRKELEKQRQSLLNATAAAKADINKELEQLGQLKKTTQQHTDFLSQKVQYNAQLKPALALNKIKQATIETEIQKRQWLQKKQLPNLRQTRQQLNVIDQALAFQHKSAVQTAIVEQPLWIIDSLGSYPSERGSQLRWEQGAGALIDIKHHLEEQEVVAKLIKSEDSRSLEELANPKLADKTKVALAISLPTEIAAKVQKNQTTELLVEALVVANPKDAQDIVVKIADEVVKKAKYTPFDKEMSFESEKARQEEKSKDRTAQFRIAKQVQTKLKNHVQQLCEANPELPTAVKAASIDGSNRSVVKSIEEAIEARVDILGKTKSKTTLDNNPNIDLGAARRTDLEIEQGREF